MAYPQGIDFRKTAGFVTDIAPATVETAASSYPRTTPQGNTVGWEGSVSTRDRSATPDARLAGINFPSSGTRDYRFDLSAIGDWQLGVAVGDYNHPQGPMRVEIFDTSTSLGRLVDDQTTSASQRFFDASGVERTATTWPTDQVLVTKTFTTTICRFRVGGTADFTTIAHAYVEAATGGGATYDKVGGAVVGSIGAGADAVDFSELGGVAAIAIGGGADATACAELGGAVALAVSSGADAMDWNEGGGAFAGASAGGAKLREIQKVGGSLSG